jgi:hypothetical protein
VFLLQSLKEATDVMAEDHGSICPKKCFKTLFCIQYWQTLTSFSKRFLSFNLEARSSALSIEKERS